MVPVARHFFGHKNSSYRRDRDMGIFAKMVRKVCTHVALEPPTNRQTGTKYR